MLNVDRAVLHGNGLLDGNNVHADAGSSGRNQMRNLLQRQEGHALEEHGKLGMLIKALEVHVRIFGGSGNEQRDPVAAVLRLIRGAGDRAVLCVFVAVIVFKDTDLGHLIQKSLEFLSSVRRDVVHAAELVKRIGLAHLHRERDVRDLIIDNTGKSPVLGIVRRNLMSDAVGDALREL